MYEYRKLTPEERDEVVRQRLAKGYPPHSPPHLAQNQRLYLLTATCYEHVHHMATQSRRRQILGLIFEHFTDAGFKLHGWVILANHYHLLVHVADFSLLTGIFRSIHGSTAYQWNREDNQQGRKVWYRYADRAIRSQAHYYTTLNYLHYNPVKHGLAKRPYDWMESSVHWYLAHQGREWLRDLWRQYPVREYGEKWDRS